MTRFIAAVALLVFATQAHARPVSYEGGWTLIEQTNRQSTSLWGHYTLSPTLSVGWRSEWDRRQDYVLHGPQATWLVNRWFGENYQANLYMFAGGGVAHGVEDNPANLDAAGHIGVLADWETRRWFLSYEARAIAAGDVDRTAMQAARIGWAPYEGDTDDLHAWLMIEVDHRPDNPDPLGVTPLIRLFKGAALFEFGWSISDDQPLANFTYRF